MRRLSVSVLLTIAALGTAAAPAVPSAHAVGKLIDQLGSDDDDTRKAAEKKLAELGDDVVPTLLAAAKAHADIDVRLRALVVARAIREANWGLLEAIAPGAAVKVFPPGGGYWFNRVRFSDDGKYAVVAGGALILYDIESGKEVGRALEVNGARPGLDLSKDGKYALTGHSGSLDAHLVEIPSLKTIQTLKGHKGGVHAVALSSDGMTAATVSTDNTVRLWDIKTGKEQGQLAEVKQGSNCVAFSPDGKQVLIGQGRQVRLYDAQTRKLAKAFDVHKEKAIVTSVLVRPDGKTAVSACHLGQLIVWDVATGKALQTMEHGVYVKDVALSPDGKRALTAGFGDAKVKLWDLASGKLVETFEGHLGTAVLGVGFSSDGRRAISSDTIACVRVWKVGK